MQKIVRKSPQARDLTPFGYWVKRQLLDRQMTSAELCKRIGCHEVYLSRIIHGDTPGKKYIPQIMQELDTTRAKGA